MREMFIFCVVTLSLFFGSSKKISRDDTLFHQISVPTKYVDLMKQHIVTIEKNGWGKLGLEDLNHGHLLLPPNKTSSNQLILTEKLFDESVGVLYHTDETTIRFKGEDKNLPLADRRPRSFVAYWNGVVIPATKLFRDVETGTRDYFCCGTVHLEELAKERPQEFALWRDYQIAVKGSRNCYVNLIIDIYYSSLRQGVIEQDGKKYVMTMDCADSSWR